LDASEERPERLRIQEEAVRLVVELSSVDPETARIKSMRWAAQGPAHAIALARAEVAWQQAGRLRAAPPVMVDEAIAGLAGRVEAWLTRRQAVGGLIAGSAAAGVATVAVRGLHSVDRYRTALGQRRSLLLADGSRIELNTATAIEVRLEAKRRLVYLLPGEAMFDIAHDAARPFLVRVGPSLLRVLGTAFNVQLRQDLVELTVSRGEVGVQDGDAPMPRVSAGSGAAIRAGAVAVTPLNRQIVGQRLAWQGGIIVFDGETLAQAVEEFNRYRAQPLVIGDSRVAALRVGGRFSTADSAKFVEALQESFPVRAVTAPDQSVILVATDGS
jgi:transmembrane sensor